MAKESPKEPNASPPHRFDLDAMREAIAAFLEAAGLDVSGTELEETPDKVARAWKDAFLDGYARDPKELFEEAYAIDESARASGMVLLKDIPFHGLCPHHLLPFHGSAHVAYLPGRRLASLSSIPRLVDCYAHRLEIQENVTREIAEALSRYLDVAGAAVALEADQTCMTMRGVARKDTRTVTQHYTGAFAEKSELRVEFLRSLESFE